jgi:hypothetical protein
MNYGHTERQITLTDSSFCSTNFWGREGSLDYSLLEIALDPVCKWK